jgi:hypothetical protein
MINRFFNIDNNVYLNSFYIISLMLDRDEPIRLDKLMISLYLLKYPSIFLRVVKFLNIEIESNILKKFQIQNIQSDMLRYSSRLYVEGFNEAIAYLYSKNITEYNSKNNSIYKTSIYEKIDKSKISSEIKLLTRHIQNIINAYEVDVLRESLYFIERS